MHLAEALDVDEVGGGEREPSPGGRLRAALDRAWDRLGSGSPVALLAGLATLVILRSGVGLSRLDVPFVLAYIESLPRGLPDWRANAVVGPALARLLGVETEAGWFTLNGALVVGVAVLAGWCVARRVRSRPARMVATTWLALASFPVVVLQRIGWYDAFTVAGAFLVVCSRSRALALAGGVLLGLTNAEQGVVGLVAAALVAVALRPDGVSFGTGLRDLRHHPLGPALAAGLAGLLLARLGLLALFTAQGVAMTTRGDVFGGLLGRSMVNSLSAGGTGVYAWLGAAWGVVGLSWFVRSWALRRWLELVAAVVALPALATLTTLDGTRVFAMVSLPALLVLVGWVADRADDPAAPGAGIVRRATVAALVLAPVLPAIISEPTGNVWFSFPWSS